MIFGWLWLEMSVAISWDLKICCILRIFLSIELILVRPALYYVSLTFKFQSSVVALADPPAPVVTDCYEIGSSHSSILSSLQVFSWNWNINFLLISACR